MPIGVPPVDAKIGQLASMVSQMTSFIDLCFELAINPISVTTPSEAHTIPGTPYEIVLTPPSGRTYSGDLGVVYSSNGTPLARTLAPPESPPGTPALTAGQYTFDNFTGTYFFAAADAGQGVQISYNSTDGSYDVNWCITFGDWRGPYQQLGGGAMKMLPTDSVAKLLYQIRGSYLQALQGLTVGQAFPVASMCAPGPQTTALQQLPAKGAGFYTKLSVDSLAILPSNPGNLGL